MRYHRVVQALRCLLPVLAFPTLAAAQHGYGPGDYPRWAGDFAVLSANVLFSGVAAGLVPTARGGSFRDGFTRGAGGGVVVYAGKRIAAERWSGAGFAGRQVASIGSSMVWNAGAGRPSFEQVALPVGPVRIYLRTSGQGPRVQPRVDALALVATAYAATRPELEWDAAGSLSSGAMVFRAPGHELVVGGREVKGVTYPATVLMESVTRDPGLLGTTFAHERVHVLQADQVFFAVGRPVQEAVSSRHPALRQLSRWVDLDVGAAAFAGTAWALKAEWIAQPWELEALYLGEP